MFTGIIERTGLVKKISRDAGKFRLGIQSLRLFRRIRAGDSVSVNGVCLTVTGRKSRVVFFDAVPETLRRTALGELKEGVEVNLELPLKWKARVSGHFVLGHVDGVGVIKKIVKKGSQKSFLVRFPRALRSFMAEKGCIAVHGVSLTLGKVGKNSFWIHIIPHTLEETNLKNLEAGCRINLEVDYLAKLAIS